MKEVFYPTMSEMEIAKELVYHIGHPCRLDPLHHLRDFYLRIAENNVNEFTDPEAIALLKNKIDEYSGGRCFVPSKD